MVESLEIDDLVRTAKAIAFLIGVTDETLLARREQSLKTDDPMPLFRDGENGHWCCFKKEFIAWWMRQRKKYKEPA